jgi:FG-GAP-like repeat
MQMTTPATNFVQRSSERLALFLIPLMIGWFAFSERAHAVNPPADGGYLEGDIGPFEFGGATPDVAKRYDFNGDGYPDYVLLKPIGNQSAPLLDWPPLQSAIWYLRNQRRVAARNGPEISSRWVLTDAADFNRDGHPDYSLFNIDNGDTKILYLNDNLLLGRADGPRVPNGWRLQKVGEFNGDGKPDYVIVNSNTRQTQIWYMNNIHIISQGPGPTLPSGWDLRAVSDFNGDGLDDYLLFNSGSGRTEIWYIVGRNRVRQANCPTVPRPWRLRGAADFNRDGHPDYLIYQPNSSPKKTGIWYLNDNVFVPPAALGPPVQSPWSIALPSGSG